LKALRWSPILCWLFCGVSLFAQMGASETTLTANPVFQQNCAKCHGKTAEGRHFGGPTLVSEKVHSASAEELTGIITNGKGHMPKYGGKLSEAEIRTLVEQIRRVNK
jgi:cytochrome c551